MQIKIQQTPHRIPKKRCKQSISGSTIRRLMLSRANPQADIATLSQVFEAD